uniref:Putative aldehyde dehydrogenase family protein n=1 Tax=uncultured marine microorganism HF4000_ANIW141A21 TaxID=455535 RepID=B3T562_9ZZZZ|nr:putative aldehyde dehydrogenase family protein [uncultured marine microorganism HF4000_ANIW141A21]
MQSSSEVYQNFVNGAWKTALSSNTYQTFNPSDFESVVGHFQKSDAADVNEAVSSAKAALASWKKVPPPLRAQYILDVYFLLKQRNAKFSDTITLESGKVTRDSSEEVKRAIDALEFASGDGRRLKGETIPSEHRKNIIYTIRKPIGVIGIITPWNFPIATCVWKIAPALVCGNTIVLKPATITPLTAIRLTELFEEVGLPKGVLNLVTGPGSIIGEAIVKHPDINGISFTGSSDIGRQVYTESSRQFKKVQCEMGGKNAVIVRPDADSALVVDSIVKGAFGSAGQRCTATSRVIMERGSREKFLDALLGRIDSLKVGDPFNPSSDLGPISHRAQFEKILNYIELGKKEGATLIKGGRADGLEHQKGYYIKPTFFDEVKPQMKIAQDEIFGPVLSCISAESLEDAVKISNDVPFGFKASIFTSDFFEIMNAIEDLDVGMIHINSPTLGGEVQAPFGGLKASGAGIREQGTAQMEFFSEEVVVHMNYSKKN